MTAVTIIIADDHKLFINGLQLLLKTEAWIHIMDVAHNGRELLELLYQRQPDIVLLDLNMPEMNGIDTAIHIRRLYPSIKIIVLSTYAEGNLIEKAKSVGVHGYMLKVCEKEELLETIRAVMSNRSSFPYLPNASAGGLDEEDPFLKPFNLTRREREIIGLLKAGNTNKQMADQLFLSVYTVETHRKNLMRKLGLNTPAALMKFIMEQKL